MQSRVLKASVLALGVSVCAAATAHAAISTVEQKRLDDAAGVVTALRAQSDGIPDEYWDRARCVVVIPDMKKAAFVFGGEYGRGVMSCRNGDAWSAPVFMRLEKGSWGFQAGAEEIDLVLLVMNRDAAGKMLNSKVSLGADASIAAGPVGRSAGASTNGNLTSEVLSYSRAHGVFAGINLSGGALRPDADSNKDAYGTITASDVVLNSKGNLPKEASNFMNTLQAGARATTGTSTPPATDRTKY
jgi:lipid-binding SYLF domain-containing protein